MLGMFNQIMFNIQQGYYRYIGSGSSRIVFDLGNRYVIKVAKNKAGIAQNKSEYNISRYVDSGLFAKVLKVSNDYNFLIMEKADKIWSMSEVWKHFNVGGKNGLFHLKEIQDVNNKFDLMLADLNRKSSWGIINGKPVIIDYGFTSEVRQRFYN